tara:strand:+ start:3001 stop:3546 length:546 start_codon:yes stop_codon:yes gene_type:complete
MNDNLNNELLNSNCQELTDIKYKTMFIAGGSLTNNSTFSNMENEQNINLLLDNELVKNKSEPWSKLSKTAKILKIKNYIITYSVTNKLTITEQNNLEKYLLESLDRKKLTNLKDVQYDKDTGIIKNIPLLSFNPKTRKFTLKRSEKRTSTLKHLTQTKNKKQAKIKKIKDKDKKIKDKDNK